MSPALIGSALRAVPLLPGTFVKRMLRNRESAKLGLIALSGHRNLKDKPASYAYDSCWRLYQLA